MRQITLLFLLLLALVGCGGAVGPDNAPGSDPNAPVSSDDPTPTVEPAASPAGEMIVGEATVESIDIRILESFPVQVHVGVRGTLGDGLHGTGGDHPAARRQHLLRHPPHPAPGPGCLYDDPQGAG